ncbi:Histone acetyltransferase, component of the RNA polymerase elongator complex [Clostridium cavendishii DSM 21758]|uniref:Histone acetyltransferase, component of the RNA polymerase elongator complex n=1 Tax=Clostridium cavendishii DSM 21758 TaxID=1121302 RepID=A0A1M6K6U8_9CLOT|nr:radical SAM protein [Clostridium cavendishii]SHJ54665.1 Histone acetyltransferase, component of the RNA polymerase elongator complex [Clostridium cavendishii DSM 21758]
MSKKHYIIPIFVPHEGCPHDCVFCNQNKITGEESKVDSDFVVNTIEEYLGTINKNDATLEVSFFGGTFTAIDINKQRELLQVAKDYKQKGLINFIRLSTRPDYIDDFILTHLKEYSVDIIELGVQSLDEEVLLKSGRGHTAEQVGDASRLIKEYGFILGHQIMVGLPGDDALKSIDTAKKSIAMGPDICRIYPALTIKDTMMEKMFLNGDYNPFSLEKAVEVVEEIYKLYIEKNINVIRIGLQPTDNINLGKDVVAGPFHAAFRELVESKIINDKLFNELNGYKGEVTVTISNRSISKLYANKKYYFKKLDNSLSDIELKVNVLEKFDINSISLKSENFIKTIII